MKELLIHEPHKFRASLRFYNINQTVLANNLDTSQAALSNMLAGKVPMKQAIEEEIEELIFHLRAKKQKKKHQPIIKRKTAMKKNVEDKHLSDFRRPKSIKTLEPKPKQKIIKAKKLKKK